VMGRLHLVAMGCKKGGGYSILIWGRGVLLRWEKKSHTQSSGLNAPRSGKNAPKNVTQGRSDLPWESCRPGLGGGGGEPSMCKRTTPRIEKKRGLFISKWKTIPAHLTKVVKKKNACEEKKKSQRKVTGDGVASPRSQSSRK